MVMARRCSFVRHDANYKSTFGKPGKGDRGWQLIRRTACGWTIARASLPVVVADRKNGRLQWFTLEGDHKETLDGFLLPANVDTFGELMLVPDLQARVTLLDGQNKVVARLGDDDEWRRSHEKEIRERARRSGRTENSCIRTMLASMRKATSLCANGWMAAGCRSCGS